MSKYLVACSGGPDSMALLHMAKARGEVVVGHVNYHKRESAKRDELLVQNFCASFNIPFYKLDYFTEKEEKGNFQQRAREVRYDFFRSLVEKEGLDGVLVAHHLDDLIETYFLQQQRGEVDYYGLKRVNKVRGVKVIRPLLGYQKKELEAYCLDNKIPYGIDESNLSDHYARNRIRHEIIEKLSLADKKKIKADIAAKNKVLRQKRQAVKAFCSGQNKIAYEDFVKFAYREEVLRHYLGKGLSAAYLNELLGQLENRDRMLLTVGNFYLAKEYGYLSFFKKPKAYSFIIKGPEPCKHRYFKLCEQGNSLQRVCIHEGDWPLTIRNGQKGDKIALRFGSKSLNRFFIDRKIEWSKRLSWPVVLNAEGEVILIPGLGCDIQHFYISPNEHNDIIFVVELLS